MIKSMTGYGSSKITDEGITVSVELKSVNNRYLETSVRLPRVYLALEEEIKNVIKEHISRGKVDVFISIDSSELDTVDVSINQKLARAYLSAFKELSTDFDIPFDITSGMIGRLQKGGNHGEGKENADSAGSGHAGMLCLYHAGGGGGHFI